MSFPTGSVSLLAPLYPPPSPHPARSVTPAHFLLQGSPQLLHCLRMQVKLMQATEREIHAGLHSDILSILKMIWKISTCTSFVKMSLTIWMLRFFFCSCVCPSKLVHAVHTSQNRSLQTRPQPVSQLALKSRKSLLFASETDKKKPKTLIFNYFIFV